VALLQGGLTAEDVPDLREQLAEEYPAGDETMNRELARLLTYLQVSSIVDRYLAYLKSDAPRVDKIHLALLLRFLETGWTSQQRVELLEFYESALAWQGGAIFRRHVIRAMNDFAKSLDDDELLLALDRGDRCPHVALAALRRFPNQLDQTQFEALKQLDRKVVWSDEEAFKGLNIGIVAVLARSGDEQSMSYLREVWDKEPQRRSSVALGLAQSPGGANWEYLLRSLPILEGPAAVEVLAQLASTTTVTDDPAHLRQLILLGLRLEGSGASQVVSLLERWTGEQLSNQDTPWREALEAWQAWFSHQHPDQPEARLPVAKANAESEQIERK
jgi:hypothetical protein